MKLGICGCDNLERRYGEGLLWSYFFMCMYEILKKKFSVEDNSHGGLTCSVDNPLASEIGGTSGN